MMYGTMCSTSDDNLEILLPDFFFIVNKAENYTDFSNAVQSFVKQRELCFSPRVIACQSFRLHEKKVHFNQIHQGGCRRTGHTL